MKDRVSKVSRKHMYDEKHMLVKHFGVCVVFCCFGDDVLNLYALLLFHFAKIVLSSVLRRPSSLSILKHISNASRYLFYANERYVVSILDAKYY